MAAGKYPFSAQLCLDFFLATQLIDVGSRLLESWLLLSLFTLLLLPIDGGSLVSQLRLVEFGSISAR